MTKHVSKAGKVDPGDRVTLPVKFAWKPEITLTPTGRQTLGSISSQLLKLASIGDHASREPVFRLKYGGRKSEASSSGIFDRYVSFVHSLSI